MWMSIVAVTLLGLHSAQTGSPTIVKDRLTHGHLGPVRGSAKYLPGDVVYLNFEVQNMTFNAEGKAAYAIGLEMLDGKGTSLMQQKPRTPPPP